MSSRDRDGGGIGGRSPPLVGQTLLVIGGSSGIGVETARRAHVAGAEVIVTGRDPERVQRAGLEVEGSIAAFDATDFDRLGRFFEALRTPVDHLLVSAPGPRHAPFSEVGVDQARRELDTHLLLPLQVAREAATKVRAGGTLLFTRCTDGRHAIPRSALMSAITAALAVMTKDLAFELAPIRVNLISFGCLGTPRSETAQREPRSPRHDQLRMALPVGPVIRPADVAALAIHLMTNTALTGSTFEIDGGQRLGEH